MAEQGKILNWTFDQWGVALTKFRIERFDSVPELKAVQARWKQAYGHDPDPEAFLGFDKTKNYVDAARLFSTHGIPMVDTNPRKITPNEEGRKQPSGKLYFYG